MERNIIVVLRVGTLRLYYKGDTAGDRTPVFALHERHAARLSEVTAKEVQDDIFDSYYQLVKKSETFTVYRVTLNEQRNEFGSDS